jgi:WD40 repeat protein
VVAALHADAHLRAFTVSGEPRWDWPLPPGLRHPAFALDASGAIAAVAGVDGIVLVTSGNAVRPLVSKPGPVTALAFTPDGKVLLALGPDGEVRLFATGDGAPLGTLVSGPGGAVFETPAGALEILGSATQLSKLVSCRFGDREVSAELCLDAFSARGLLAGALSGADDAVLPLL